ncbi:MAG: Fpg/Nei family DNA glycosylase [Chloroflexi bacterium]|nr:Fpg/Nei family DNA glycosylase [Chloroflexota bacterium]
MGQAIQAAQVLKPTVLRSLAEGDFASDVVGRRLEGFRRLGKFLLIELSDGYLMAINPMLTGALQYCPATERVLKKACLRFSLDNGRDLRYLDDKQMGMVYYVSQHQLKEVPRLSEQGPDVLSNDLTFDQFKERLRRFQGEIKGILTRGAFLAGIGNAYSDEVLFDAGIYPFRKRASLSEEELARLYQGIPRVLENAIGVLRSRMGEEIHVKIRDFLQVHGKGGQPCPRCGNKISSITANQRITNYCRHCQPGLLVRN